MLDSGKDERLVVVEKLHALPSISRERLGEASFIVLSQGDGRKAGLKIDSWVLRLSPGGL